MYKQINNQWNYFFTAFLFAVAFASCEKDKEVDIHSPAFKISMSEKLFIPVAVELPDNLPAGNSRVATYYAEGVQQYKAQVKAGGGPNSFEWVFVAPLANLYDISNKKVGTHGAGPYWELSAADSIFAQHFSPARTDPDPGGAIDWLLLKTKTGKTPTGLFADVSYIQRIATTGGKAPAVPPSSLTETAEVKYTAIYRFTKKNP